MLSPARRSGNLEVVEAGPMPPAPAPPRAQPAGMNSVWCAARNRGDRVAYASTCSQKSRVPAEPTFRLWGAPCVDTFAMMRLSNPASLPLRHRACMGCVPFLPRLADQRKPPLGMRVEIIAPSGAVHILMRAFPFLCPDARNKQRHENFRNRWREICAECRRGRN